jgi:hypothetical protein
MQTLMFEQQGGGVKGTAGWTGEPVPITKDQTIVQIKRHAHEYHR